MRCAVVGIDGTGKTTVLRRIHEEDDIAVIHAIRAHEDPGSPFAELSTALADASAAADALGSVHLKVATLYLQLCLYGPAERQATDQGQTVLADRHPLIDPLVYLPLFGHIETDDEPGADVEAWWLKQDRVAARAVRNWLRTCSGDVDPWPLGAQLLRLGTTPPREMLDQLSLRFGVAAPDAVLLFDLPVAQAVRRIGVRTRGSELHETTEFLSATRQRYDAVLDWLEEARPEIAVRRIDCCDRSVDEVSEQVRDTLEFLASTRAGKG
jgi:thymidylate kinase